MSSKRLVRGTSIVLVASSISCSGADFAVDDGVQDAGDDTIADLGTDSPGDSASDAIGPDTTPPPGDAPCSPLPTGAGDVYVDKRYAGKSPTGTVTCPFTTIQEGITAAAKLPGLRVIHVAGDSGGGLVYNETGSLFIDHNVTLRGDGPGRTIIVASGVCGSTNCAINLSGAATLDSFTVTNPSGDGVLAGTTAPAPIIRNVTAENSKANGIFAQGAIELGPNVSANKNGLAGVYSPAGATGILRVAASGGANAFDFNGTHGINVEGAAVLNFEGGTASNNTNHGVRLTGPVVTTGGGTPTIHSITSLTAKKNGGAGIAAFTGQSIKLRSSILTNNIVYGLAFSFALGSSLDLGLAGDKGGNLFGGASGTNKNGKAAIRLCNSRGTATQPADGNTWSACPPTQTGLSSCDPAPTSYFDVAYSSSGGDPVVTSSCTGGP